MTPRQTIQDLGATDGIPNVFIIRRGLVLGGKDYLK